jgi:hypothetical protein
MADTDQVYFTLEASSSVKVAVMVVLVPIWCNSEIAEFMFVMTGGVLNTALNSTGTNGFTISCNGIEYPMPTMETSTENGSVAESGTVYSCTHCPVVVHTTCWLTVNCMVALGGFD